MSESSPQASAPSAASPAVDPNAPKAEWPDTMGNRKTVDLPLETRQALELTRQHVQVGGLLSEMNWGKDLQPYMRKAVNAYCERYGIDASTELDVLGGNFYINSEYYLRKLGEMRRAGVIADFWFEHVQNDPRLLAMSKNMDLPEETRKEAQRKWSDMMFKRIDQNAPEEAAAICICYIVLHQGGHVIKGCKWGGNGTSVKQPRSGGNSQANPIVEANSELSVESQAARRAARQIVSHVNDSGIPNFDEIESGLEDLSKAHQTAIASQKERETRELAAVPDQYKHLTGERDPIAVMREGADGALERVPVAAEEYGAAPHVFSSENARIREHRGDAPITATRVVVHEPSESGDERTGARTMPLPPHSPTVPTTDGPVVYAAPRHCIPCNKTVAKSNDHDADCREYLD